jgi:hypothetical protein
MPKSSLRADRPATPPVSETPGRPADFPQTWEVASRHIPIRVRRLDRPISTGKQHGAGRMQFRLSRQAPSSLSGVLVCD